MSMAQSRSNGDIRSGDVLNRDGIHDRLNDITEADVLTIDRH